VSYLAAGGIQGLRPLRYEKRVARNRFIFFVIILFLALLGTLLVFLKGHR
jgi:cell division protein FtsB